MTKGALLVSVAALTIGCGAADRTPSEQELEVSPGGQLSQPAKDGEGDYRVVPPSRESQLFAHGSKAKRIIYLNQHGGTYTPGWDDSSNHRSSIIDRTVKMPPYRRSAQSWTELTTCVAKEFARWNVTVTDEDPGQTPHLEVAIGGMPSVAGFSNGIDGISPMASNGSIVERAVVYVFSENMPANAQYACQVTAHEIGHAYGLEHEYLCSDPMTYLEGCGHKTFQDKEASCGTYAPAKCRNGGKQNTVLRLNAALGLAKNEEPAEESEAAPPKVSLLAPSDGATFEPQATVTVKASVTSDAQLKTVSLRWQNGGKTERIDCDAPVKGTTCSHSGSTYTFTVRVGSGSRSWSIEATDVDGHVTRSATRSLSSEEESAPEPAPIPDLGGNDDVDLVAPATVDRGKSLPVVVTGKYLAVFVVWSGPTGSVVRKLERDDDGAWKTKLQIAESASPGPRTLQVMAVDGQGATLKGASRKVVVR